MMFCYTDVGLVRCRRGRARARIRGDRDATPSSIGKPELRAFYNYATSVRGHMALAMIATLSAAFTWGQESIPWRLGPNPREGMTFDHPDGRVVLVAMPEFSAWVAAADAIERTSIGDSFYLALFTGQRQTERLMMRDESDVAGRHAFRQSKTGELVDIKKAPQLSARLNASRARIKALKLRLQLETLPVANVCQWRRRIRPDRRNLISAAACSRARCCSAPECNSRARPARDQSTLDGAQRSASFLGSGLRTFRIDPFWSRRPFLQVIESEGLLFGGRTRARTWDPLIKSQLLYQLSYAPGTVKSGKKPSQEPVV